MTFFRFFLAACLMIATLGISTASVRAQNSDEIALGAYYYLGNGQNAPGDMAAVNAWRSQVGRFASGLVDLSGLDGLEPISRRAGATRL